MIFFSEEADLSAPGRPLLRRLPVLELLAEDLLVELAHAGLGDNVEGKYLE